MPNDARMFALLEEAMTSEQPLEDVCRGSPELLPRLRAWMSQCRDLDGRLDRLFPPSGVGVPTAGHSPVTPVIPGYAVERVLGRGGTGIVYLARHEKLGRVVALKMLLSGEYAGASELTRLVREARAIAALRHPNIVQVFDVGDVEGRPFFTMEFVEDGTLAERLNGQPLAPREAAALLVTLADATEAAHRAGIVHRDLKPANVLMAVDGTPKISDFGLARHFAEEPSALSLGGQVGTPGYMAPEQVRGTADAGSPAVDVYALGAVLYEVLTGRPPFRGASHAQTHQQVLADEPVPPSRLNAGIPRDLQVICLKCLCKVPAGRYASAAALAADLRRWLRGEPIEARPAGRAERVWKWARRHPALATGAIAATLLLIAGSAGLIRVRSLQRERWREVDADLADVRGLQDGARWAEADATLRRAAARLNGRGPTDLSGRVDQARRDLDLVTKLDAIHLSRITEGDLAYYREKADRDYRAAFAAAGVLVTGDSVDATAGRVNHSAVRAAAALAVDDWSISASDPDERRWLLELARHIESSGPDPWGDRIRDADHWAAASELTDLARKLPVDRVSVSALLTVGERLKSIGMTPSAQFLRRVQQVHPADFWVNLTLGTEMLWQDPGAAEAYCRAALACRPGAAVSHNVLGDALRMQHRPYDAIACYRRALALEPQYARAKTNLGNALKDIGRFSDAMALFDVAIAGDPQYGWAYHDAGDTLMELRQFDPAAARYQAALQSKLDDPQIQRGWRTALVQAGRADEAIASWQAAIRADPSKYATLAGYAELSLYLGHDQEYETARATLLERFGHSRDPANVQSIAFTCLLKPGSDDELRHVATLLEKNPVSKSATPEWVYHRYLINLGLLAYRRGHFTSAVTRLSHVDADALGPCPALVKAMAQADAGDARQARATLAGAILQYDWRTSNVTRLDLGKYHVLRREAEAKLLPNLQAFLAGQYEPQGDDERVAMTGACAALNRYEQTARLYADAFAASPSIADHAGLTVRFQAACAAVKAGGDAPDGTPWRAKALQWLGDDLAFKSGRVAARDVAARVRFERELGRWQTDPDLADVREVSGLDRLPASERAAWVVLWQAVATEMARLENPA